MIRKAYLFAVLLSALYSAEVTGNCPNKLSFWKDLKKIEGSVDPVNKKIERLTNLSAQFLHCGNVPDSTYAQIVHRLGALYIGNDNMETALSYTRKAISVNLKSIAGTDKSYLANSYYNLGIIYSKIHLSQDYIRSLDSCIYISKKFPSKYFLAMMAFSHKAFTLYQNGDYQKCIETSDEGILLAREIRDIIAEASLLSQKVQSQIAINDLGNAKKNIQSAISIFSGNPSFSKDLATTYAIYAQLLMVNSNYHAARQYYLKSYRLNEAAENWPQCSRDMLDLGYLYDYNLHDFPNALACYERGLTILEKASDDYQKAGIYINIGVLYWRQNNYKKALIFYQKALNTLPIHFSDPSIFSNPNFKMLSLVSNDYYVYTLLSNKAESLLALYKKEKKASWLSLSIKTYKLADKLVDQMRWKQQGEQSKLFWRSKTREMYEKAIEACYLANNAETAFFFMEKSRAVLLNDKLNELGALAKLPLAETFRDQKYRAKVTLALQNTMSSKPDSKEWEKNLSQLLTVKTDFENYIKTLETKYPAYYQYKYSSDVPTLSVLKNNLHKKKASFIQYFMADSMTYILYVTSAQVKISRLTPEKLSLAKINRFNQICSDKKFQNNQYHTFALMSHELYVTLIQPLALHEGRVIICADNILIPFEALSKDSLGTHFLLNDYIFSYTYSASFLLKDFPVTIPKGDFIGFAPVHFQPHLNVPDLKESGNLMRDAAKFYSNSVVHTGLEATKNCFLDDVFNYGVVNIFSHASAGSAESESYLYLQDSIIRLSELNLSRRLATRLIILTACETNIGKSARGEGIFSLARGFASAGTQSIAATLWQADEDAIYAISTLFNQYLAQGMDKGDALRKAKINFIKADNGEKTMPYYWANMVLIGNSDSIKLTNPNYIWPFALILVAILLFILLFRLLRHQVDI